MVIFDTDFDSVLGGITAMQHGGLLAKFIYLFFSLRKCIKNKHQWKDERNGNGNTHCTFLAYVNTSYNWAKNNKVAETSVDK